MPVDCHTPPHLWVSDVIDDIQVEAVAFVSDDERSRGVTIDCDTAGGNKDALAFIPRLVEQTYFRANPSLLMVSLTMSNVMLTFAARTDAANKSAKADNP